MIMRVHALSSVVAAGTMLLVGYAFHLGAGTWAPGITAQFANRSLYRDWNGWTSIYMAIHPLWFGVVFAAIFALLRAWCHLPANWKYGLAFGVGLFLAGSMPVFLLAFASFQMSPEVLALWLVQNLCQYAAAGTAIGAVAKRVTPRVGK